MRKSERKGQLGRLRRSWEDGIRMDLGRLTGSVEWVQLPQYWGRWRAVVNAVTNLRFLAPRS
jgi:hypothetical protein